MNEPLITIEQAAQQLNVTQQTIRKYIQSGQLQAYKLGNKHQTTQAYIDAFLDSQKVQVTKS